MIHEKNCRTCGYLADDDGYNICLHPSHTYDARTPEAHIIDEDQTYLIETLGCASWRNNASI